MTQSEQTSWCVIGRAATGDAAARDEFARRYGPFLRRVFHRRWAGTPYRVHFDDAVQDSFVQCFKPGGVIERADASRGASVRTLLYAVARNVAWRCERDHQRAAAGHALPAEPVEVPDGLHELTRGEARGMVREALRRLCESIDPEARGYGELLRARAYEGQSVGDLAAGDAAAAARLHREYAKAKRAFGSELAAVAAADYPVPPSELRLLLLELLSSLS